jgi:chorismate mutase
MVAKREYGSTLFDLADVPPILDAFTWGRVCAVLATRSVPPEPPAQRLLSGIVHCGRCGVTLIGGRTSADRGSKAMYVCKRRNLHQGGCGVTFVRSEPVDALVAERVCDFLSDRDKVSALLRQHAKGAELEALHQRVQELSESLLVLDQALRPPPGKPRMPIDRYWAAVEAVEEERDTLMRRMATSREASLLAEALSLGREVSEAWQTRPLEWQRAIIKLVTERIEVGPGAVAPKGQNGNRFDPERVRIKFSA